MIDLLVTLRRGADREAFMRDMDSAGVRFEAMDGIGLLFIVEVDEREAFPLVGHPAILDVEAGDTQVGPHVATTYHLEGGSDRRGWALARHVRRANPFADFPSAYPVDIEYRCERTGKGVDLYVCDSGVRATHREFAGRTIGVVYENGSTTPGKDAIGHGTACMSMAAGATCGSARDANLFSSRYLDAASPNPTASSTAVARAINACVTHFTSSERRALDNPGVINMSFGQDGTSNAYNTAVMACASAGLIPVIAAGNDAKDLSKIPITPALSPGGLLIGGCEADDRIFRNKLAGTNFGNAVDTLVVSRLNYHAYYGGDDEYADGDGTSYGCAHATGFVACMLEGYKRAPSYAQAMQLYKYIYDQSTFGTFIGHPDMSPMTPAILYLDPRPIDQVPSIPGWVRKS